MVPSLDELRKNYESFDDGKLLRLATEEATSLRPEALELLEQIIKERRLSKNLTAAIDIQFEDLDEETLNEYCNLLRKQPCPICGTYGERLNATVIGTVMSFIVMSSYTKELRIACPACLDKLNDKAVLQTMLLGWWEPLHGIINSLKAISLNNKMKKEHHLNEANPTLKAFVRQSVGRIELNRNNTEELRSLITYIR